MASCWCGPTGSGKTKCYKVLAAAMSSLKGQPSVSGGNYEAVNYFILNPKSITMGQLYGEFDLLTHEWTDGILPALIRVGAVATDKKKNGTCSMVLWMRFGLKI
ncbi:hypothetical protein E2320_015163 [Naja naja]|nr:hypothetical protein E2320_015163 [Naja naja]